MNNELSALFPQKLNNTVAPLAKGGYPVKGLHFFTRAGGGYAGKNFDTIFSGRKITEDKLRRHYKQSSL